MFNLNFLIGRWNAFGENNCKILTRNDIFMKIMKRNSYNIFIVFEIADNYSL